MEESCCACERALSEDDVGLAVRINSCKKMICKDCHEEIDNIKTEHRNHILRRVSEGYRLVSPKEFEQMENLKRVAYEASRAL